MNAYIYVPQILSGIPGNNAQILLDALMNATFLSLLQAAAPVLPLNCYEILLSMTCHAAFPTCTEVVTASNKTGMRVCVVRRI